MNKEITIYELLGLVKDNKAPKKIKYEYSVYELTFERNDYYCKQEMRWFTNEINSLGVLNDKVEILEEDEDIEELKITNEDIELLKEMKENCLKADVYDDEKRLLKANAITKFLKLQNNWNELKKWLGTRINTDKDYERNSHIKEKLQVEDYVIKQVMFFMQELEQVKD